MTDDNLRPIGNLEVAETCEHVLHCNHASWVEALLATIKLRNQWMKTRAMDPNLQECIYNVRWAKAA